MTLTELLIHYSWVMPYLLGLLVALSLADVWSTERFLARGEDEDWPPVVWLLERIGWTGVHILKAAVTLIAVAFFWHYPALWPLVVAINLVLLETVLGNLDPRFRL